jgi:GDP-mannose 6-dehydrogenase
VKQDKVRVSIFGLGYVGTVTAACLAHKGHRVTGVDVNPLKVEALDAGRSPIVEARLDTLIADSNRECRLHATTNAQAAVLESDVSFVSVGTPSMRNGKPDFSGLEHVCFEIGNALRNKDGFHTIVVRSTVLPGTAESLVIPALEQASGKREGHDFAVCVNPEFMREGTAVADFYEPPFTVLGASDPTHLAPLRQIYEWAPTRIFETSLREAEMVKYLCNTFHAVKVTFANEMGTLCRELGVDAHAVTEIFTSDTKLNISPAYLKPGFAFGGSCLPKDVRALAHRAKELDLHLPLLQSVLPSNTEHLERAVEEVLRTGRKKIGVLGLSFKSGTDDLRESPMVQLVKKLLGEGRQVQIWDPDVVLGQLVGSNRQFIEETIPHIGSLLSGDLDDVVGEAEVILIGAKAVDREELTAKLQPQQIVLDLVKFNLPAQAGAVASLA